MGKKTATVKFEIEVDAGCEYEIAVRKTQKGAPVSTAEPEVANKPYIATSRQERLTIEADAVVAKLRRKFNRVIMSATSGMDFEEMIINAAIECFSVRYSGLSGVDDEPLKTSKKQALKIREAMDDCFFQIDYLKQKLN